MRGVYTVEAAFTSTGNKTLIYIECPTTCVAEVLSASLSNYNSTTSEQLRCGLYRVLNKGGPSGPVAVSGVKHEKLDPTTNLTLWGNLNLEPTSYETYPIDEQGFNNLAGYRYDPTPEERPIIGPTGAVGLRLIGGSINTVTGVAQIVYREIG